MGDKKGEIEKRKREKGRAGEKERGREGRRRNIIITCLPSYSPLTPKGSL